MTHDEKLNSILYKYLYAEKFRLENNPEYFKFTFDFIIKSQKDGTEKWEKEFLKERLFKDGYLIENGQGRGEPYIITNAGKKFIQEGGYLKERERKNIYDEIQKDTLKTNKLNRKNSRLNIILLVLGIFVSIFLAYYF
jgi:hypothetical protein